MLRRSTNMDESFRDRFMMRPSIARMTLDLDYGELDYGETNKETGGKAAGALQQRLAELLVFEIKEDGETRYNSLSVRGLYKYVLKSIKYTQQKRPTVRPGLDSSLERASHQVRKHRQKKAKRSAKKDGGAYDEVDQEGSSSSDSEDEETEREINAASKKYSNNSSSNLKRGTSNNTAEDMSKSVSFGGAEGPVVTEHPPGIPHSVAEEQLENNIAMNASINSLYGESVEVPNPVPGHGPVTYRERLGGFLHPRDMRRLVTPFSASNEPELIVRRHVMLLNFDPLRAVILRDRLLVLVPDGADSLLVDLEKRVRGGAREIERSIFGESGTDKVYSTAESSNIGDSQHSAALSAVSENAKSSVAKRITPILKTVTKSVTKTVKHTLSGGALLGGGGGGGGGGTSSAGSSYKDDNDNDNGAENGTAATENQSEMDEFQEWEEMENRELSFELTCVDAILGSVCAILGKDSDELRSNSIKAMDILLTGGGQGDEILRHMKNSIKEMTSRVKGFIRAMSLVLDETEDMALMNISRLLSHPERFIQPVPEEILNEESDEPELILEAHLQHAFSLTNSLDLIRGEIQSTQELINQRLDGVRNRLLLANMVVSIGSFCVAFGSFIGSIFGMNVTNHIEQDPDAFKQIVLGTVVGMVGLMLMFGIILWYAGTLPSLRASF